MGWGQAEDELEAELRRAARAGVELADAVDAALGSVHPACDQDFDIVREKVRSLRLLTS